MGTDPHVDATHVDKSDDFYFYSRQCQFIMLFSNPLQMCHSCNVFLQHIEISLKKVKRIQVLGIDTDSDRHALDPDPDPDPAK
jgi:hypothetical protein